MSRLARLRRRFRYHESAYRGWHRRPDWRAPLDGLGESRLGRAAEDQNSRGVPFQRIAWVRAHP